MVFILARNWWALVLRGVLDVLFGVAAFAWPEITFAVLAILFGAFALVDGCFAIAAAVVGSPRGLPWWALLVEGLLGIVVGAITCFWPGIAELALLLMIAAWAVATGILEVVAAIRLRKEVRGEWLLALSGLLSVVLGVALAAYPRAGIVAVSWMIGAYATVFGVLFIVLGLRLRSWAHREAGIATPRPSEPRTGPLPGSAHLRAIATSTVHPSPSRRESAGGAGRAPALVAAPQHRFPGVIIGVSCRQVEASEGGPSWQRVRRSSASTSGRPTASSR